MQISIELQYLHSSRFIQIIFALSEYDSLVFSVGTSPANHQIHAIYYLSLYFWYLVLEKAWRTFRARKHFVI